MSTFNLQEYYNVQRFISVPFIGVPLNQATPKQIEELMHNVPFLTLMNERTHGPNATSATIFIPTATNVACLPWRRGFDKHKSFPIPGTNIHFLTWSAPWAPKDDFHAQLVYPDALDKPLDIAKQNISAEYMDRAAPVLEWKPVPSLRNVYHFIRDGTLRIHVVGSPQWLFLKYRARDWVEPLTEGLPRGLGWDDEAPLVFLAESE
ncbi:hypothetical protein HMN09_00308000 [Mycena chlorophos]|uniref:Uncharacterized protein n=1 Tax=Mycena chlorophos TaxID=658473 RepID=A0A8H6THV6_MYCCL|nr:hypothetical protein HMN09_00308000 [Mycena chlorophos]